MIVLDTNVISEPLKPLADPAVLRWLDAQDPETLYLTATALSEVLIGIALLPAGKRKRGMAEALRELQTKLFAGRFLSFDREAAIAFALLGSRAAAKGYSISVADCQIAAIAAVHGFAVATRDTAPFLAAGVPVVNPWEG
ncbi:MAG TPA: type II toxin-antitoxin system VapC family toxin [Terracidiphilus sp.]|nr:type II toxin-antitoxin system VapC family toxin [Terracidiphilus sp.]